MATRKKTPVECRPASQRDPRHETRHETRDAAPSGCAPTRRASARSAQSTGSAAQPGAGLASAVLQLPLRFAQPRTSLSASMSMAESIEHTYSARPTFPAYPAHAAPIHGNISRLSQVSPISPLSPTSQMPVPPAGKHTSVTSVRQRFGELREALAEGFEIVQPIFARPLWTTPDDSATAFNFVLTRERTTRLVIVPEGRTIQRFIRERHLAVDYRR